MATVDGITYTTISYAGDQAIFKNGEVIVARRNTLNGYQRTGHTEPFFTHVPLSTTNPLETTVVYTETNVAGSTIDGATPIENTEYRNSVTYGSIATATIGTPTVVCYNHNFRVGDIFEDSVGFAYKVTAIDGNTLTVHRNLVATITDYQVRTVAKDLDLFGRLATKNYAIGEKVLEATEVVVDAVLA